MDSRLVLVIEGDEPAANQLAAAIREADYEVVVSDGARAGLDIAIEIKPDCVVCDVDLPDEDGYWVARNIRTHASLVAVTPFLFLSPYDDADSRLQGFHVGADVYMTKPFEMAEVVAQVDALVKLAARLRQRRDSMLSSAPEQPYGSTAIEGDLRQMSIATVLSLLGMERRTGVFEVVSKKRRAQIEVVAGYVVHGTIGGTRVAALAAMSVMLSWKVGRFSFTPLPECDPPESRRSVQALLLDAAKAEDEAAASGTSFGALAASSFGGPPSRPDDTAPPTSRAMRDGPSPVSLAFDLLARRAEDLPAAEVAAAVDPAVAAYERGRAPANAPRPQAAAPAPAAPPPVAPTERPPAAPRPVRPARPAEAANETSNEASFESVSIDLAELDEEAAVTGERVLADEDRPAIQTGSWGAARDARPPAARANAPSPRGTPPSGTPLGPRRPAIVPPAEAGLSPVPLPAPPAAPRPVVLRSRSLPRPQQKKS